MNLLKVWRYSTHLYRWYRCTRLLYKTVLVSLAWGWSLHPINWKLVVVFLVIPKVRSSKSTGFCFSLLRLISVAHFCWFIWLMCGNNHWIITPNLARSIQIDLWPGGQKSYLWQPVIASPVIQQTKMEEPQTAVSALLGLVSVAYWW